MVAVAALVLRDELGHHAVGPRIGYVERRGPRAVGSAGGVQVAEDRQRVVDDVEVELLGLLLDVVGHRVAVVAVDAEAHLADPARLLAHLQVAQRVADLGDAGAVADGHRDDAAAGVGVARGHLAAGRRPSSRWRPALRTRGPMRRSLGVVRSRASAYEAVAEGGPRVEQGRAEPRRLAKCRSVDSSSYIAVSDME